MQIAPGSMDPNAAAGQTSDRAGAAGNIDVDDLSELLDKRSELMKRGRVKRVYYQTTETIQTADLRGEFADLEELEDKQEKHEINRDVKN